MPLKDKAAQAAYNRKYRREHAQELQEYAKRYQAARRDALAVYWKQYRKDHQKEFTEYERQYHIKHRERKVAAAKKWTLSHLVKHKYHQLRSKAKYHGVACSITFEEYAEIATSPCHYCGGPLPETGYGIDRINSDIGYVAGNIRPCCYDCNKAKSAMTETEFAEWVLRVVNHWIHPKPNLGD